MKKYNYRTLEISGSREDVKMYLDRECMLNPKIGLFVKPKHPWEHVYPKFEFINIIRGISDQLKEILYYRRKCTLIPNYEKSILGLIHKQLVNDNLDFSNPTPHSGRWMDDNYLISFWFECRTLYRSSDYIEIAYVLEDGVDISFWKDYLIEEYPMLSFTHYERELTKPIPYYRSSVVYYTEYNFEEEYENFPEDFLLADLDLV